LKWTVAVALPVAGALVVCRAPAPAAPAREAARERRPASELPALDVSAPAPDARTGAPPPQFAVATRAAAEQSAELEPACAGTNAVCVLISGTVLDASGGIVAGARINASDGGGALRAAGTSDESGRFRLQVTRGLARVSARADGYSEQVQAIEAPLDGVRFVLAPESSIDGRVVVAGSGQPVADALVTAVGQDGPQAEPHVARSSSDGTFRVSGLLAGSYSFAAVARHWRAEPRTISVGVAETLEPIELKVRAAAPVRGRVRAGGEACARGSVFLRGALNLFSELGPDGNVAFDGVPSGSYTVDVRCVGALAYSEELGVGSAPLSRVWELDRGLELRGVARTAGDMPLADAPIEVSPVGEPADRNGASCSSDLRGEFTCAGLEPGQYDCVIGSGVPARGDRVRVSLGADSAPYVVLKAHAEGALRVRLEGSRDFEQRTLTVVARSKERLLVAEPRGAELVFEPIALGAYEVALDSAAHGSGQRVVLTRPGEVVELSLPLPSPRRISGRVVDEAGQAVPDAWISVAGTSDFAQFRPSTPVLSDGEGQFILSGLLPARYQLSASSGRRTAELEVASDTQGLIVTLRESSSRAVAEAAAATSEP
jgi:hypothetical protein